MHHAPEVQCDSPLGIERKTPRLLGVVCETRFSGTGNGARKQQESPANSAGADRACSTSIPVDSCSCPRVKDVAGPPRPFRACCVQTAACGKAGVCQRSGIRRSDCCSQRGPALCSRPCRRAPGRARSARAPPGREALRARASRRAMRWRYAPTAGGARSLKRETTSLLCASLADERPRTMSLLGARRMPSGLHVMPSSRWSACVTSSTSSSPSTTRTVASSSSGTCLPAASSTSALAAREVEPSIGFLKPTGRSARSRARIG